MQLIYSFFQQLHIVFLICVIQESLQQAEQVLDTEEEEFQRFKDWKQLMNKHFSSQEEEDYRFKVFEENNKFIRDHNSQKDITYTVAVNQFADLTLEEFKSIYLFEMTEFRLNEQLKEFDTEEEPERNFILHKNHDRKQNHKESEFLQQTIPDSLSFIPNLSPVKNQGGCGSCYAFAAISTIEFALARKGQRVVLSEQEIVDCTRNMGNNGCNGGWFTGVYQYVKNKGISQNQNYPYKGNVSACRGSIGGKYRISNYYQAQPEMRIIKQILAKGNTLSFAIQAGVRSFQLYRSGVYIAKPTGNIDHGVAIVGYGVEQGQEYLIIRNSWGTGWGEKGYMRVVYDMNKTVEVYYPMM